MNKGLRPAAPVSAENPDIGPARPGPPMCNLPRTMVSDERPSQPGDDFVMVDARGSNALDRSDANPIESTLGDLDGTALVWSGWYGSDDPVRAARDPACWSGEGFERLKSVLAEPGGPGRTLLVRPHAAHVVNDVPTCRLFLELAGAGVRLALDPAMLLSPSMIGHWEEHFARIEDLVLGTEGVTDLVITGWAHAPDDPEVVLACPLSDGRTRLEPGGFERMARCVAGRNGRLIGFGADAPILEAWWRAGAGESATVFSETDPPVAGGSDG